VVTYDPQWPEWFEREAERIRGALGRQALRIEHAGSTAVPGLAAKPVIDIVLAAADSADEEAYVPSLEAAGYELRIREPEWHEHRMFRGRDPEVNLHVFSAGCPEVGRMLRFRDRLRVHAEDRELYARAKAGLAREEWGSVDDYARAKSGAIEEIMARAGH